MDEALKKTAAVILSPVTRPPDGVGASPSRGHHAGDSNPLISSSPSLGTRTGNVGQKFLWHLDEMSTIKEMQDRFAFKFDEMDEKIAMQIQNVMRSAYARAAAKAIMSEKGSLCAALPTVD